MATAARSLSRTALSLTRRLQPRITTSTPLPTTPITTPTATATATRPFSTTPFNQLPEDPRIQQPREPRPEELPPAPEYSPDLLSKEERSMYDMLSPEERAEFDAHNQQMVEEYNDPTKRAAAFAEIEKTVAQIEKEEPMRFEDVKEKTRGFWGEDEDDDFSLVEDGDEAFNDDDITSMAHAELELHREMREYARITAWDMPFLSKLAKPFTLPPSTHILRFRYTTYLGEHHPAEPKVVVELCSKDLTPTHLSEPQRQTFLKLVGPRYNPTTDIVRMSCEKFTDRAQNKRYLGDLVSSLVREAREGDSFADVPLDLRHHKPKKELHFPREWNMTERRKRQLQNKRARRERVASERHPVDGNFVVALAAKRLPSLNPALQEDQADGQRERVAVHAGKKGRR